jgi:hypothetical protein
VVGGLRLLFFGAIVLGLVAGLGCSQRSANPVLASASFTKSAEKLLQPPPEVPGTGLLQTSAVVPFGTRIPAGTPIVVRLLQPLSSATARAGQVFAGVVEEEVSLDGQVLMERGTAVRGRVVESSPRRSSHAPGYLRLSLTEVSMDGKPLPVRTYSSFFKGAGSAHRSVAGPFLGERLVANTAVLSGMPGADVEEDDGPEITVVPKAADAQLGVERRLVFHLLEPLSLFPNRAGTFLRDSSIRRLIPETPR